jgi:dsRNA-specific ribonuclease
MAEDRLTALEERLGHRFANRALMEQAVTHASASARMTRG